MLQLEKTDYSKVKYLKILIKRKQKLSSLNHRLKSTPNEDGSNIARSWKVLGSLYEVSWACSDKVCPLIFTILVSFESDWVVVVPAMLRRSQLKWCSISRTAGI